MCQISTERVGQRVYVTGNTYSVRQQLKSAGCHWDGERKQWWIGAAKASAIETLVSGLAAAPPAKEDLRERRVYAKVNYKGRSYYVIGESGDRCRLTVLDGSLDFWCDKSACELVREYQPRQQWDGRRYSGRTVTVYQTLGALQDFVAEQKRAKQLGHEQCAACGKYGDDLVRDLEDGLLKHPRCCDIEP